MYLIDWEYSGTNDPMFDLAALFLENEFAPEDEELFFHYYYGAEQQPNASREKILIFKILQDYLWSIWTVLKESRGDDFGSYGIDRFTRAQRNIEVWKENFTNS
jgi:thiamine kinase-like enzyme